MFGLVWVVSINPLTPGDINLSQTLHTTREVNSLRPSDAYVCQQINHQWLR